LGGAGGLRPAGQNVLDHLLTLCVLGSHTMAMRGFVRALRERRLPEPIDFTALSAIMYYDLGLVAEWLTGEIAASKYFPSIWELEPLARIFAFGFFDSAPWFIRAGGWCLREKALTPARQVRGATSLAKATFVVLALSIGAARTWWAFAYLPGRAIWEARANIGLDLGLFVMFLYLPLHLLAFYIQRPESRTPAGRCVALLLTAFAIGATLPIGQRTNALLPVLLLLMFWRTPTLRAISAGALRPVFCWGPP